MLPIILIIAMIYPIPFYHYQEIITPDKNIAIVSWYGVDDGFDSHITASGEIFDACGLTFAHNELPFKTNVRFTYRGKSVIGYCNDRGDFDKYGREFDVSYQIAKELGFVEEGIVKLEWEIVDEIDDKILFSKDIKVCEKIDF